MDIGLYAAANASRPGLAQYAGPRFLRLEAQHQTAHMWPMEQAKHDHVNYRGEALVEAARKTILAAGDQWTDMRAAVFQELIELDQPASAYDIAERMTKRLERRVVPNSVYRILDLFVSSNLALRIESLNSFVANRHPDCVHDCIFLICDDCGSARHVDDDAITKKVRSLASRDGFAPERPVIEVHGRCSECAASKA